MLIKEWKGSEGTLRKWDYESIQMTVIYPLLAVDGQSDLRLGFEPMQVMQ